MRLSDARAAYEAISSKASDVVRQLSFAGIGLIWIFKSGPEGLATLDVKLLRAALFIFLSRVCDLFQYLAGTTIWYIYFRYKERQGVGQAEEFSAPVQLNWPTWCLFYLKSILLVVAYAVYIIPFLIGKFVA